MTVMYNVEFAREDKQYAKEYYDKIVGWANHIRLVDIRETESNAGLPITIMAEIYGKRFEGRLQHIVDAQNDISKWCKVKPIVESIID